MDRRVWCIVKTSGVRGNLSGVAFGNSRFVAVGAGEIIYSLCNQAVVASALNYKLQNTNYKQITNYNVRNYNNIEIDLTRPLSRDPRPLLNLTSPNGDETLQAGEKFLITWKSESEVEKVKLEYSPDNGTTYLPIAVDVDNIGHYQWLVPHHISSHCLVRISEVKEKKMPPHGLVYEMDFRVNGAEFSGKGDSFTIYLGDAADESIKNNLPGVSFGYEANGKVYIQLDNNCKEIGRFTGFNDRWHNVQVFMDNVYDRISVILDGHLVFENIPRSPMAYFSPALSFAVGADHAKGVDVDDVAVRAWYSLENENRWFILFSEDFERLKEKYSVENSGWRTKGEQTIEDNQKKSGLKHLSIKPCEGKQVTVVKSFNVPVDFPFDISDKTFEIRYNNSMYTDTAAYDVFPVHGGSGASASNFYSSSSTTLINSTPGISRTSELFNTYYIYTFDGKLLAEYDHNGNCIRDYIYFGDRLIAEYKPQTSEYFYYMTDQINSTRIITNYNGDVVFSEAYGPYGDIQKTWTNTYNPKMKFSGKEREGYSDLDYFGARYFDHKSYRFNSVDPIITREKALSNPQLWNLYAYCDNNPITFFDPDGRQSENQFGWFWIQHKIIQEGGEEGIQTVQGMNYFVGMASAGMSAAIVGYFAGPEIIVSMGAAISKVGDKISRIFDNIRRNSRTFERIYKNLERQLQRDGVKSIFKTLKSHQKALLEHTKKLKDGLEYDSQVKATINRIKIAIKSTEKFIKDRGLK